MNKEPNNIKHLRASFGTAFYNQLLLYHRLKQQMEHTEEDTPQEETHLIQFGTLEDGGRDSPPYPETELQEDPFLEPSTTPSPKDKEEEVAQVKKGSTTEVLVCAAQFFEDTEKYARNARIMATKAALKIQRDFELTLTNQLEELRVKINENEMTLTWLEQGHKHPPSKEEREKVQQEVDTLLAHLS